MDKSSLAGSVMTTDAATSEVLSGMISAEAISAALLAWSDGEAAQ